MDDRDRRSSGRNDAAERPAASAAGDNASARARRRIRRAWLIYDGECPVCKRYALYLDARNAIGELVLVDARHGGALVEEIEALPHDLNDGMALKMDGRYYLGDEVLNMLARLSGGRRTFDIANRLLFGTRRSARTLYPILAFGRRTLLRLLNIPRIGESGKGSPLRARKAERKAGESAGPDIRTDEGDTSPSKRPPPGD